IKVYLGHPEDVPLVNELGFAVSPGTHTLIAMSHERVTFLKPPYGKCGNLALDHFANYTYNQCIVDCHTNTLINKCGCKLSFMPGLSKSLDRILF
ncbi:hypothetical protein CAPTEDRAFT_98205, partial [Capitella teleta]